MPLLPADTPRMPKWPFLAGDALLLGLALAIGFYAHNPFAGKPLILIFACVALGAVLGTWPFIADYERKRNEMLDERQRGLETLAQTITSSAEQISIAAQSLSGIAETAAKNFTLAEQLPARLQEKMGEIRQCLAEVSVARKESSASGQAAESERLATTADHIRQAMAELAKLESTAQKNLAAAGDKLDAKATQIFKQLEAKIGALSALAEKFSASPEPARGESLDRLGILSLSNGPAEQVESVEWASTAPLPEEKPAPVHATARKEPEAPSDTPASVEPVAPAPPAKELKATRKHSPSPKEPETSPGGPTAIASAVAEQSAAIEPIVIETPAEKSKTPRKRTPKKPKVEDAEPSLDLDASTAGTDSSPTPSSAVPAPPASMVGDEFSQASPDEASPATAVSADGATRLLVTAYIGIGNKLFLRGDGPGLSWDQGVPLQFVSIGKWRWETADATVPVHAKLYKNDEVVCSTPGKLTLDPGQQAEVTAAF
ncbi:MAG TPA: hypothetical protein VNW30_11945 [Opitutaceae bacterium]|jgi:hypothetical protein|nr:hypothetical protein [Opitutaceae bacterium]